MTASDNLIREIKSPITNVFRRIFIKRRLSSTGLYESDWHDISNYIIKWGKISTNVDAVRLNTFQFGTVNLRVNNEDGLFNPEDDPNSLWFGLNRRLC